MHCKNLIKRVLRKTFIIFNALEYKININNISFALPSLPNQLLHILQSLEPSALGILAWSWSCADLCHSTHITYNYPPAWYFAQIAQIFICNPKCSFTYHLGAISIFVTFMFIVIICQLECSSAIHKSEFLMFPSISSGT